MPGTNYEAEEIEIWLLPDLMRAVADEGRKGNAYFGDDTLRTITLFARGVAQKSPPPPSAVPLPEKSRGGIQRRLMLAPACSFWDIGSPDQESGARHQFASFGQAALASLRRDLARFAALSAS